MLMPLWTKQKLHGPAQVTRACGTYVSGTLALTPSPEYIFLVPVLGSFKVLPKREGPAFLLSPVTTAGADAAGGPWSTGVPGLASC